MKYVVITGATSMVGVALIEECIRNNIRVLAIVRKHSHHIKRLPKSELLSCCEKGLEELSEITVDDLPQNFGEPDVLYHLGWAYTDKNERDIADLQIKNIDYTLQAVALAKRLCCKRFVGAGSQAEFGICAGKLSPDSACFPVTAYGVTKLAAGQLAAIECRRQGLEYCWGRIFSVYGKYDRPQTMIMTVLAAMQKNMPCQLTMCEQQWDYLYSADVGRAFLAIGTKGKTGSVYCVGYGATRNLKDYVNVMYELLHPKQFPEIGAVPYSKNQIMYLSADISSLTADTGFLPEYSFEKGIAETISFLK